MTKQAIPSGMTEKEYYETMADESAFLEWYKTQDLPKYETPSVTADMVAYCFVEGQIKLLVIKRKAHPYQNKYALVGGFPFSGCSRINSSGKPLSSLPKRK